MDKCFKYKSPEYSCTVVIDVDRIPCGFNYEPATHIIFRYVYDESGKQPFNFKELVNSYVDTELSSNLSNDISDYIVR